MASSYQLCFLSISFAMWSTSKVLFQNESDFCLEVFIAFSSNKACIFLNGHSPVVEVFFVVQVCGCESFSNEFEP